MNKLSIIALIVGAAALTATVVYKIVGKKCSCKKGYDDSEFDDDFEDYDFETCDCSDDLDVAIPAEESDDTVEVKVEPVETEKAETEEKTEE